MGTYGRVENMSKRTFGIIGLVMYLAAFLAGLYGILQYSVTAAGIYLIGSLAVYLIFVYAFCAKCPVRDTCNHVIMGMVTHSCPPAQPEPILPLICSAR